VTAYAFRLLATLLALQISTASAQECPDFNSCLAAAQKGDAEAQFSVGTMLENGEDVLVNKVKARKWYVKSAAQGHSKAQFNAASMYLYGDGGPKDTDKALDWFTDAANKGILRSQLGLVEIYYTGEYGVHQDYLEAEKWLIKAANQGDAGAQNNLGQMYYFGALIPRDYLEAEKWLIKAANQGDAGAQYNLGQMYYFGALIPRDFLKMIKYTIGFKVERDTEKAVKYIFGFGVPKNINKAVMWYKKSANQGHVRAQYSLGYLYDNHEIEATTDALKDYADKVKALGLKRDEAESYDVGTARQWYQKAADAGDAASQYSLGKLVDLEVTASTYETSSVLTDAERLSLFEMSAEQGYELAIMELARIYSVPYLAEDYGVDLDPEKVFGLRFKHVKEGGEEYFQEVARFELAKLYLSGLGVRQDFDKAYHLFKEAAKMGSHDAANELAQLYIDGNGTSKNLVKAYMLLYVTAKSSSFYSPEVRALKDLARQMDSASIDEAKNLSKEWQGHL